MTHICLFIFEFYLHSNSVFIHNDNLETGKKNTQQIRQIVNQHAYEKLPNGNVEKVATFVLHTFVVRCSSFDLYFVLNLIIDGVFFSLVSLRIKVAG